MMKLNVFVPAGRLSVVPLGVMLTSLGRGGVITSAVEPLRWTITRLSSGADRYVPRKPTTDRCTSTFMGESTASHTGTVVVWPGVSQVYTPDGA